MTRLSVDMHGWETKAKELLYLPHSPSWSYLLADRMLSGLSLEDNVSLLYSLLDDKGILHPLSIADPEFVCSNLWTLWGKADTHGRLAGAELYHSLRLNLEKLHKHFFFFFTKFFKVGGRWDGQYGVELNMSLPAKPMGLIKSRNKKWRNIGF